ncbi:hypothetical protein MNBD_GAMMA22-830 [hydrothermal vent metagenome]|uniref:Uncharacterized protein n=1 Tax=hydrothermal vent metagenome TaxID=652676 RepID=A0A3B1ACM9_9ZZZZ
MACVNINRIEFDQDSRRALNEIRTKLKLYKYLKSSMVGGTLLVILSGKDLKSVYTNIKTTDFQALGQALNAIAGIQKRELHRIAALQVMERVPSINRSFWEGIENGCKI